VTLFNRGLWFIVGVLSYSVAASAASSGVSVKIAKSSLFIDQTSVPDFDPGSGTSLIGNANIGLDWLLPEIAKGFSIEAEYTQSDTPVSVTLTERTINTVDATKSIIDTLTRTYEQKSLGGYLAYDFPVSSALSLKARVGYLYVGGKDQTLIRCSGACDERPTEVETIGGIEAVSRDKVMKGYAFSFGASVSYAFFKHAYAVIEFNRMQIDYGIENPDYYITHVGFGVGLRL